MFRAKKTLIVGGALVGVLLVAGGGFLLWRQRKSAPPVEPPQEKRGPLVVPPPAEETVYENFVTADERLSLEYPSAWTRSEIKNLETVLPKNLVDKYGLTMPLILSDPRGAQITLSSYQFAKGTSLDAAMEMFKADLVAMGQPYNEVSRQVVGDSLIVDSTVDAGQGTTVKVRDLLFLVPGPPAGEAGTDKDTVYNISFSARQEGWVDYEAIFDHIQTTARLSL